MRLTMKAIVDYVAALVGDEAHTVYEVDRVERVLDRNRMLANYVPLQSLPTLNVGSSTTFLRFVAEYDIGFWESDTVVTNNVHTDVTADAASSDLIQGTWTFAAEPDYPLYVSGYTYDVFVASSQLLDEQSLNEAFSAQGDVVRRFDVHNGGFEFWQPSSRNMNRLSYQFMMRARWQALYLLSNPKSGYVKA